MPFRKSPSMDRTGVERMAEGWGKIVARRVHEEVGADLDLDADDIEQMAVTAARAVARGTIADLLERKASLLGTEQPCPTCRRPCVVRREPRAIDFWGGEVTYAEPSATARPAAGIFSPQRPGLRLTPHDYSPSVLGKIVRSAAREPSFREAAEAMAELAEVTISGRQLGRIAREVGEQLQADRDEQVDRFRAGALEPRVETRPALAVVEVDGGRLQIRGEGAGPGAHEAAWREDKIAILATMAHVVSDPTPSRSCPTASATGDTSRRSSGPSAGPGRWARRPPRRGPGELPIPAAGEPAEPRRGPELAVRTYVATTARVDQFGPMVAAEARRRNFAEAAARAFLGDGSAWIWGLQRRHFPTFVPIVDFLHALGHIFTAAKAGRPTPRGDGSCSGLGGGLLEGARRPGDRGAPHLVRCPGPAVRGRTRAAGRR